MSYIIKNMKKIAIFNHKGGVSKTTTAFNVGWKLASKGKKVLLVDADSQCNLSLYSLGNKTLIYVQQRRFGVILFPVPDGGNAEGHLH